MMKKVQRICPVCTQTFMGLGPQKFCSLACWGMSRRLAPTDKRLKNILFLMKDRCGNPKAKDYAYYGAKGIEVCKEWRDSFSSFREWAVTHGYESHLQIDRINNRGNYCPDNCRWVTRRQQNANRGRQHRFMVSCPFKGVLREKNKWIVRDGVKRIGSFTSALKAALAYDDLSYKKHGEYAYLNFPERHGIFRTPATKDVVGLQECKE